jgi:hypothetical protein
MFPNVNSIPLTQSGGNGNYQGLHLTAEYRAKHGISLLSNYAWSHDIDNYCGDESGSCSPWPQLVNNRHIEKGDSGYDIRHNWATMVGYQLPFGKRLSGFTGALGKGWQVNGIFTVRSGPPMTISDGNGVANTGAGDRPNLVGDWHVAHPTIQEWFNPAAFATQPYFTIGNVGRNTVRSPGATNLDCSLFKSFPLWSDTRKLQFRVESFNILNHPNFDPPDNSLGDNNFGMISSTGNYISREFQFGLRLVF